MSWLALITLISPFFCRQNNVVDIPEKLEAINELTDETFADHVGLGQHFVKFYAPWCGHCQVKQYFPSILRRNFFFC